MSTSGSTDYSVNRDKLITGALRLCGVIAQGETPSASQISEASDTLNIMVKAWEADGLPLWAITTRQITLLEGVNSYVLSNPKPLKALQAWNRQTSSSIDIPMRLITRQEYNILGNKETAGNPIQVYFEPNLDTSTVFLFPTPDAQSVANNAVHIVVQRPFEDFDASTDTPDFPQEWYEAVKYGLAARLAGEYNIDIETRKILVQEAGAIKQTAMSFGLEEGSMFFGVERRGW